MILALDKSSINNVTGERNLKLITSVNSKFLDSELNGVQPGASKCFILKGIPSTCIRCLQLFKTSLNRKKRLFMHMPAKS